jgi:prepilin-type N-terminal cleavage/methylation domain-containing protein
MPQIRRSARRRAGFTLIELMVALTIAAMVIGTVYAISGWSARHFQEQQRIAQLQLGTRLAMDRIRRDIDRAGAMATSDSNLDRPCPQRPSPRRVVAVQLVDNSPLSRGALAVIPAIGDNRVQADAIRLVGNFSSSDSYLSRGVNSAGDTLFVQMSRQSFRRSFAADPNATVFDSAVFREVFAPGRMLHVWSTTNHHYYFHIVDAGITGADAWIRINPPYPPGACGDALLENAIIAPVSEIEYALSSRPADLLPVRDPMVTGPMTALVRRELHMATGAVLNERTVLEWAVHFDVDAAVDTAGVGLPPVITRLDDAAAAAAVAANPSRVRSLFVTIAARTPEQDPRFPWVAPPPGAPLSRFRVFPDRRGAARVRVATQEIALLNLVHGGY